MRRQTLRQLATRCALGDAHPVHQSAVRAGALANWASLPPQMLASALACGVCIWCSTHMHIGLTWHACPVQLQHTSLQLSSMLGALSNLGTLIWNACVGHVARPGSRHVYGPGIASLFEPGGFICFPGQLRLSVTTEAGSSSRSICPRPRIWCQSVSSAAFSEAGACYGATQTGL